MTVPDLVPYDTDIAGAAALIADPTRAAILRALISGRPLAAGELARLAGVSAATASFHLAKLLDGGMIDVARQGRHRYYRLAGHAGRGRARGDRPDQPAAAGAQPASVPRGRRAGRGAHLLRPPGGPGGGGTPRRHARPRPARKDKDPSGRTSGGTRFDVTGAGARTLAAFGINVGEVRRARRHFAGECIDWTQRRGHLNGALAAAITARLFEVGWIERGITGPHRRSVRITAAGGVGLADTFGFRAG